MNPGQIAVAPLYGNPEGDESLWVGALLSKLLADHLAGLDLEVLDYNDIAQHLAQGKHSLPLSSASLEETRTSLSLRALIHGRYIFDEESRMLGFSLFIEAPSVPRIPLEASSPIPAFSRFLDRVAVAIVSQ